ncbi:glycosyltransferase family 9 protein [Methyloradius palustris]|nr:glycosyltransferase family 9 protein [Methyloradius palustris]
MANFNKKLSLKVKIKAWAMRRLCKKESPQPLSHQSVKSILVMRYDRIGDMIVTTPLIHVLRKYYPDSHIMVLASKANYDVIIQNPDVDEVLIFPKSLLARIAVLMKLRKRKLSMVVDLYHDLIWHAIIAIRLIRPTWVSSSFKNNRYGVDAKSLDLYDVMSKVDVTHPISEIYLGIATALGAKLNRDDYFYRLNPNAEQRQWANANIKQGVNVGINLFSSHVDRRLKSEDCIALCQQILNEKPDANVFLLATHQTLAEMKRLADSMGSSKVFVLPPKDNIMFIVSFIKLLNFLITPDTSLVHVACACNTPFIGVYPKSSGNYTHWKPKHLSNRFNVIFSLKEKSLDGYSKQMLKQAVHEMMVKL